MSEHLMSQSTAGALRVVALMEDLQADAEFIESQLVGAGFLVLRPNSVAECEDCARQGCTTFILDMDMGAGRTVEGLALLDRLKQINPDNYCVMFTNAGEEHRSAALKLSCDAFISKMDLRTDFDQVLMALDRMWLVRATRLSLRPGLRVSAGEMADRVEVLRKVVSIDGRPLDRDERKRELIARYQELLALPERSSFEEHELERLDLSLAEIEREEADEFDVRLSTSRAGKLDQALDRIESYVQELRAATGS